jgi:hypothetical protein
MLCRSKIIFAPVRKLRANKFGDPTSMQPMPPSEAPKPRHYRSNTLRTTTESPVLEFLPAVRIASRTLVEVDSHVLNMLEPRRQLADPQMNIDETIGYYTFRSFANRPIGTPSEILWGKGEMLLLIFDEGIGNQSHPCRPGEKRFASSLSRNTASVLCTKS